MVLIVVAGWLWRPLGRNFDTSPTRKRGFLREIPRLRVGLVLLVAFALLDG